MDESRVLLGDGGDNIEEIHDELGAESRVLDSRFEIGDMVWGKVKSHPWWPGHLFNEAFANSSVRRSRKNGLVLVAFFGDSSYGWFDPTELVPYDPHYAEKSKQTASKNFVRAVEDSIDEVSRRSALALSCRCRNPSNFRPVNVPGYVAVDVVDYDPNAVYSWSQIRNARDSFRPLDALSFIKDLAVGPMSGETKNLDFIKNKAATLAYRRSVFEEFDETYAQAFNQQTSRTSVGLPDKEPSRAPLSGPLVIADTLNGRKSSTKATKNKEQLKKDRYLLKRRDKVGDSKTTQPTEGLASSSSSSANEDGANVSAYVLQKRETEFSNDELGGVSSSRDEVATSAHVGPTMDGPVTDIGAMVPSISQPMSSPLSITDLGNTVDKVSEGYLGKKDDIMKKKKKKVAKRPVEEPSVENSDPPKKKIKKVKKKESQMKIDHDLKDPIKSSQMPFEIATPLKDVELPQILADLKNLALNSINSTEKNGPEIFLQFFLKFRSVIYVKSSSSLTLTESEHGEVQSMEGGKEVSSLKLQKSSPKNEDQVKGKKRTPSERQEEKAVKRAKKITEVKSLSAEKRALLKTPDLQRSEGKSKMTSAQNSNLKPIIKTELREKKTDHPPRIEEPTYLIMKFQSSSSLPSLGELKARFARFGPLDVSLNRVFYKTNTCRVAFVYKQDANVAYRYAMGSKSLFSNVKFFLKPVSPPEPQQLTSGMVEDIQGENSGNRDSTGLESRSVGPTLTPQLKSCLKKPSGSDESGGGSNARTARVRFNMGEVKDGSIDTKVGQQVPKTESRKSMLSNESSSSPSSSIAMDISNNQRFNVPSHPLQSQPPILPLPPQFIRAPSNHQQFNHMVELSPKNNWEDNRPKINPSLPFSENQTPPSLPPQPQVPPTRDISHQMMSLLTRCHDVVANVKSMLGYVPYHPL